MVPITTYLFEDLAVVKNTEWPGEDIKGVSQATNQGLPDHVHVIMEKGTPGQVGYARFEYIGAMSGEDWHLLVGAPGSTNLWDLNLQAPA